MKKLLLGALLLLSTLSFSQKKEKLFSGGLIITNYKMDTRESSNIGVGVTFTLWNIYFDINSNWVGGRGEQLDFQSSQSYDTYKTNVLSINGGYSFQLNKKFIVTPTIGMTSNSDIWEDPIGNTTNFSIERESKVGIGCNMQFEPLHPLNLLVGYNTNEGLKFGIIIDFNSK
jgi:hypothetical protein